MESAISTLSMPINKSQKLPRLNIQPGEKQFIHVFVHVVDFRLHGGISGKLATIEISVNSRYSGKSITDIHPREIVTQYHFLKMEQKDKHSEGY